MSNKYVTVFSLIQEEVDIEKEVFSDTDIQVRYIPTMEQFKEAIKEAHGIIIADTIIDEDTVKTLKNCKVIVRQGIGYDNIDLKSTADKGIAVCNVPDYCVEEVADHTIALILTSLRNIPLYDRKVKEGVWDINVIPLMMQRLNTQVLGLAGFGKIPRQITKKARHFFSKVIVHDPFITKEVADEYGVELVSMDELVESSDILSVHIPLSDKTKHLFNKEVFIRMKPTAYFINTSRGPVVNEQDLYEALKNKQIAGAAIDVMEKEPPKDDNPLLTLDNIIITPHAAFYSQQSYYDLRRMAAEEAKRVLTGQEPLSRVNK